MPRSIRESLESQPLSGLVLHHRIFVFFGERKEWRRACSGASGDLFRFLHGYLRELSPFMGTVTGHTLDMPVRQSKEIWLSKFSVTCATRFRDDDNSECQQLPDAGTNCVTMNAIFFKIIVSDRQTAVLFAAVVREFDFDPGENHKSCPTEDPKAWGFEHLDRARRELAGDLMAASSSIAHELRAKLIVHIRCEQGF
jgi:hypothetical protein